MAQHKASTGNHIKPGNKPAPTAKPRQPFNLKRFLQSLGPGLITGASDAAVLLLPSATLLILFSMERSRVMVLPESKA